MPLKVVLQTMTGRRLDEAVPGNAELNRIMPDFEDASYPMLRYVDPHGETIFNSNQMYGIIPELDRLAQGVTGLAESKFLERVRVMAEGCKGRPDCVLRFVGD